MFMSVSAVYSEVNCQKRLLLASSCHTDPPLSTSKSSSVIVSSLVQGPLLPQSHGHSLIELVYTCNIVSE